MGDFLVVLAPAFICTFIWKLVYKKEITGSELMKMVGLSVVSTFVIYFMFVVEGMQLKLLDHEILNGQVIGKYQDEVSCEHSYQICTSTGKTTTCTTYYEHSWDYDWVVETSVGKVRIDRVDRQGVNTPNRWKQVKVGEPASLTHSYQNYLKANEDSLFYMDEKEVKKYKIPEYPKIFDYYKTEKVISQVGIDPKEYNTYLNDVLRTMGASKQVNIVAIFTSQDKNFFEATLSQWGGIKKNDVFMVFGLDGKKIKWFKSTSFANGMNNKLLHTKLRNNTLNKQLNLELFKSQVNIIDKEFERLPNEKFQHLKDNMKPPLWLIIATLIFNFIINGVIAYKFANNYERE